MEKRGQLKVAVPILLTRDINKAADFYTQKLGFTVSSIYPNYLIIKRDETALHFSLAQDLDPKTNSCMTYIYVSNIDSLYAECQTQEIIHPNGALQAKDYGMKDFAVIDPDGNLLTFGESTA